MVSSVRQHNSRVRTACAFELLLISIVEEILMKGYVQYI